MTQEEAEALSPEKLDEALAAAVKAKDKGLPEALAKSKNKTVARAAKKALYQLKSSGVEVAHEAPKGEQPNLSRDAEELPALLSAISGTGERALFFVKPRQGGGLDSYQAIVHDEVGILQLERGEVQRSKYKRNLEQLRKEQAAVLEAPLDRALEELAVAWSLNGRSKQPLPPEAESLLRRLGVVARDGWPPLPPPEPGDAALTPRSGHLHEEREIQQWLPGAKYIQLLTARLDEVDTSPLQLTEPQKQEQRMQKVALTAAEMPLEERRTWAMRLWRTAEVIEANGRADKAALARAEARMLFHDPKAPSQFLEKLFVKLILLAMHQQQQQAQAAGQGQPAPMPAAEPKSPGGLILP